MDAAEEAVIVEGMTTTAMIEFARQINREIREAKEKEAE